MSQEVILQFTNEGVELVSVPYPFNFLELLECMERDGITTEEIGGLLCG